LQVRTLPPEPAVPALVTPRIARPLMIRQYALWQPCRPMPPSYLLRCWSVSPGSGRSSLGRALSDALILQLLARDQVRRSLDSTARAWAAGPGRDPTAEDAAQ
jgi:hypothetical protein